MKIGSILNDAAALSWNVPVPVRPSRFVPLRRNHAPYNVEVDLGAIGAFAVTESPRDKQGVLWCDLQDNPEQITQRRLGSGRAGVYKGRYLKGVGRTTLAANWADPSDTDYNTGHLHLSGAIREYLVSEYLAAKGCGRTIVPAEGLLVRRRCRRLKEHIESRLKQYRRASGAHSEALGDLHLQGLTVKPAGFARYSNVLWMLHRIGAGSRITSVVDALSILGAACDPSAAPIDAALSPAKVAERLAQAVDRGWHYFYQTWSVGVFWRSTNNNFTIDGRFLDLECPVVLGRPSLALVMDGRHNTCPTPSRPSCSGFFEVLGFVSDSRSAIRRTMGLLNLFLGLWPRGQPVREIVAEALRGLRSAFSKDHWLWSTEQIAARILTWTESFDLTNRQRAQFYVAIRKVCRAHLEPRWNGVEEINVTPLRLRLARIGLIRPTIHLLAATTFHEYEEARFMTTIFDRVEKITDVDELLSAVAEAAADIRRLCFASVAGR